MMFLGTLLSFLLYVYILLFSFETCLNLCVYSFFSFDVLFYFQSLNMLSIFSFFLLHLVYVVRN